MRAVEGSTAPRADRGSPGERRRGGGCLLGILIVGDDERPVRVWSPPDATAPPSPD